MNMDKNTDMDEEIIIKREKCQCPTCGAVHIKKKVRDG
jgi:hypothetical protein